MLWCNVRHHSCMSVTSFKCVGAVCTVVQCHIPLVHVRHHSCGMTRCHLYYDCGAMSHTTHAMRWCCLYCDCGAMSPTPHQQLQMLKNQSPIGLTCGPYMVHRSPIGLTWWPKYGPGVDHIWAREIPCLGRIFMARIWSRRTPATTNVEKFTKSRLTPRSGRTRRACLFACTPPLCIKKKKRKKKGPTR